MESSDSRVHRFGDYSLNVEASSLSKGGEPVAIGRKSFGLLVFLIEHERAVVTKAEILEKFWPGLTVVENNVDQLVSKLNAVLGKAGDGRKYVETVHGEGYKFRWDLLQSDSGAKEAPISESEAAIQNSESPVTKPQTAIHPTFVTRHRGRVIWLALGLIAVGVVYDAYRIWQTQSRPDVIHTSKQIPESSKSQPYYKTGRDLLVAGEILAARTALDKAAAADQTGAAAHAALSFTLLKLGYEVRAADEAQIAVELSGANGGEDSLLAKAQLYAVKNDWAKCARTYETLFSFYPGNAEYGIRHAVALSLAGKETEAREALDAARRLAGDQNPVVELAQAAIAEHASKYQEEYADASLAENLARSKHSDYLLGQAELEEAWALDNLARLSGAEQKARDAQRIFWRLRDPGDEGKAWKDLGDVSIDEQRVDAAASDYRQAINRFHAIGYRSGEAVALNNLGYVLRDYGDLAGAAQSFEESLRISRSQGDLRRQAMALDGIAIVLKRRGNLSGAEEANRSAIRVNEDLGNEADSATALNNLAIVLQDEGKLDEAEQWFRQALHRFQEVKRPIDVAMVYGNLGDLELRRGFPLRAEPYYRKQIELGKTIPQPKQEGYGVFGLGEVAFLRCQFEEAASYIRESLRLRESAGDRGTAAESRAALAEVLLEQKKFRQAEDAAQSAATEFEKERQIDQQAESESLVAEALLGQGKTNDSMAAANAALKLANASEDRDSEMNTKLRVSNVLAGTGRFLEARQMLESVVNEAAQSKYGLVMLDATAALVRIKYASGDKSAQHQLEQVRREASKNGLLLIAERASMPKQALTTARAKS